MNNVILNKKINVTKMVKINDILVLKFGPKAMLLKKNLHVWKCIEQHIQYNACCNYE